MALTSRQTNNNYSVVRPDAVNIGTGDNAATITEGERRALESAFEPGASGELLIGIKAGQRFLTLCLPTAEDGRATPKVLSAALDHLRRAGCERAVRVHRE